MQKVIINNRKYKVNDLLAQRNKVIPLVAEYKLDPNCHPPVWIGKKERLSDIEEASFIFHCLNKH